MLDGERGLHDRCAGVFGRGRGGESEGEVVVEEGIGSAAASWVARLRKRRGVMWRLWRVEGHIVFKCRWSITLGVTRSCSDQRRIEELRR